MRPYWRARNQEPQDFCAVCEDHTVQVAIGFWQMVQGLKGLVWMVVCPLMPCKRNLDPRGLDGFNLPGTRALQTASHGHQGNFRDGVFAVWVKIQCYLDGFATGSIQWFGQMGKNQSQGLAFGENPQGMWISKGGHALKGNGSSSAKPDPLDLDTGTPAATGAGNPLCTPRRLKFQPKRRRGSIRFESAT